MPRGAAWRGRRSAWRPWCFFFFFSLILPVCGMMVVRWRVVLFSPRRRPAAEEEQRGGGWTQGGEGVQGWVKGERGSGGGEQTGVAMASPWRRHGAIGVGGRAGVLRRGEGGWDGAGVEQSGEGGGDARRHGGSGVAKRHAGGADHAVARWVSWVGLLLPRVLLDRRGLDPVIGRVAGPRRN